MGTWIERNFVCGIEVQSQDPVIQLTPVK